MKKAIILILSVLCIFSGCNSTPPSNANKFDISGKTYYKDYKYNNSVPLEECTPVAYALDALNEYFGKRPLREVAAFYYGMPLDDYILDIDEVNLHFPITNIRASYDPIDQRVYSVYTVYRTVEGGYFYVDWIIYRDDPSYSEYTPKSIPLVGETLYLDKCPRNLDFSGIVPGESTAADVEKIDPYLCIFSGGIIDSVSIIHPYSSILIRYEPDRSRDSSKDGYRNRLVVTEIMSDCDQVQSIRVEDFP